MSARAGLLAAAFLISAAAGFAQTELPPPPPPGPEVPAGFLQCAAQYRRAPRPPQPFDCSRRMMDGLRGARDGANAVADASVAAQDAARLYVSRHLTSELRDLLWIQGDDRASLGRLLMLDAYMRAERAAAETKCDLHYQIHGGDMSTAGYLCNLGETDRLIADLIDLVTEVATLTPVR